jgi:TPR repeat protein
MKIVSKNYSEAQKILSNLYSENSYSDLEKMNLYKKYLSKLRISAYSGYTEAQFELGLQYENIYFFCKNPNFSKKKCIYWYRKACAGNIPDACNNLAIYLESEIKNETDFRNVLDLYKKAISLGSGLAKSNLKRLAKGNF